MDFKRGKKVNISKGLWIDEDVETVCVHYHRLRELFRSRLIHPRQIRVNL